MEVLFLGTGASLGVPMIGCTCEVCTSSDPRDKRLRTSVLISGNGENILIDAGPDFREQMLRHGISGIDAFLITHPHRDHIGGLDDTRAVYYAMGKKPLQFYAENFTLEGVYKYYDYLFPREGTSAYHGAPGAQWHRIEAGIPFRTEKHEILPLRAMHGHMPVTGFKTGNLVYLTDVKSVPEQTRREITNNTVLVLGALHRRPHHLHFNLEEALKFVAETKPRRTYLIHMSHWMGKHKALERELPPDVFPAYDGLRIEI